MTLDRGQGRRKRRSSFVTQCHSNSSFHRTPLSVVRSKGLPCERFFMGVDPFRVKTLKTITNGSKFSYAIITYLCRCRQMYVCTYNRSRLWHMHRSSLTESGGTSTSGRGGRRGGRKSLCRVECPLISCRLHVLRDRSRSVSLSVLSFLGQT